MSSNYALFDTRLAARRFVSPSMLRITLAGESLRGVGATGLDQRVKVLPGHDAVVCDRLLASEEGWYQAWLAEPDESRPWMRTYTFSGIRPDRGEVDIDVAMEHGHPHGPGAEFALRAELGSRTLLVGPVAGTEGHETAGVAWLPDYAVLAHVLIVADETALPAARAILADLPPAVRGTAIIEVPERGDVADLPRPTGVDLVWCPRDEGGDALRHLPFPVDASESIELSDDVLWAEAEPGGWLGWVAGESHWVARIRKGAKAAGVPRHNMSFMGYWRRGVGAP
ncbi:siderophore-interacting protein [Micrococcales bacterium 31B]|nr:siderophore-interacting protein [Micrococcales bacterium 31B]